MARGRPEGKVMALTFHVSAIESDYRLYVIADIAPTSLSPAPEWEWVNDPNSPTGGYSRRTGRALTDDEGRILYSVPVHIATMDGREVRGARVRIRQLKQILPALRYLRPTGDVVAEISGRGALTLVCDSIEVLAQAAPRHGEAES